MLDDYEKQRRNKFISGLQEMLDWFVEHPDLPAPVGGTYQTWDLFANSKEEFLELRRAAGVTEKTDRDNWLSFSKKFDDEGNRVFHINIEKDKTCSRVQVGEKVVPAKPAEPEKVVPVFEWRCDEPLLSPEPVEQEHASV